MILKGEQARKYFAHPDPKKAGALIAGADAMTVALRRQELIASLIGPHGEAEMRLTRLPASDLRKDKALLPDALRASGFFAGPRVVFVEDASDSLAATLKDALDQWQFGDAVLVVSAGALTGKSALKTLFETRQDVYSAVLYDEPPSQAEVDEALHKAGLVKVDRAARTDIDVLARALDPSDFRQLLEKISLYKYGDESPLSSLDIAALAPATIEAEVDDVLHAVAEGQAGEVGRLMQRLAGQGVLPVTLCIQAIRYFRMLHIAASEPGGVSAGLAKARVFGPRRTRMQRQLGAWRSAALEKALSTLIETDLALRSSSRAPGMAVIERSLIRLAMMRR